MPEENKNPKSQKSDEEPRVGVYICNCGGNISDVVSCQKVVDALTKLPNVTVSRQHMFMCSDPGQNMIQEDIRQKGINRVVVGACSPFLHETTFRNAVAQAGLNPYLYHHVGLREQDSWVHHDHPEEATEKAIHLMAAGIAKARYLEPLEPIHLRAEKRALVIGGGVAGLRSTLDMARRGLKVILVEKTPFLGGRAARLHHVFPTEEEAGQILEELIGRVTSNPNVTVLTRSEVVEIKGYVGNFQVRLRQTPRGFASDFEATAQAVAACPIEVPDDFNYGLSKRKAIFEPFTSAYPPVPAIDWENCTKCGDCLKAAAGITLEDRPVFHDLSVGAVVVATGFKPYEPRQGEFGFGEQPQVITLPQLERLLDPAGPTGGELLWQGKPVRRMAMIHCVGSRQLDGVHEPQPDGQVNDYCSRVCCTATLHAADEIRQRFPKTEIFDLYQDIRTYGRGHEEYYRQASDKQVIFLRYLGEEPPQVTATEGEEYPLVVKVNDRLTNGEEIEIPVDLVVLAVGMMPSPVNDLMEMLKITPGKDRFLLEVHPKLRPVETAVHGVVLAGTAQAPMNIQESSATGSAAAAKVNALPGQGAVELEPFVARVDPELCKGSGECVKICPYEGAISMQAVRVNGRVGQHAEVSPANCKGCGICVGACPNGAIDLLGWSVKQYDAMLDALVADLPELEAAK